MPYNIAKECDFLSTTTKRLIICLAIPLGVGALSAFISMGAMDTFKNLNQPPLSPPSWLFPVVWTILYLLMGFSLFLVTGMPDSPDKTQSIVLFAFQLFFNFMWSIFFFNLELYFFSFIWLVGLWTLIIFMILSFKKVSPLAAYINIPYLLWVTFAGYLNLAIALLN